MSRKMVIVAFLAAALVVAGVVSYWASRNPDGLDSALAQHKVAPASAEGATAGSPLADYKVPGVSNEFVSNGLAGILGAVLVLGVISGAGYLLTRGRRQTNA